MKNEIKVQKRDDNINDYEDRLVVSSVKRACVAGGVDPTFVEKMKCEVRAKAEAYPDNVIPVNRIHSWVNEWLCDNHLEQVSEIYTQYHQKMKEEREKLSNLDFAINRLVEKDESIVHENANKDSRAFNTMRDLTAGTVSKAVGLNMIPKEVASAHIKGKIHWHDLDYSPFMPMTNCCLIDFKHMFENGFTIGNAAVATPKSIQTATAQMAQIIANVASSQYGGCSVNRIDELLEPYALSNFRKNLIERIKFSVEFKDLNEYFSDSDVATFADKLYRENTKDCECEKCDCAKECDKQCDVCEKFKGKFTDKEIAHIVQGAKGKTQKDIYDSMQSLEFECNTLYSSGGQTPFITVNFGLGTSWVAVAIQEAILNVRLGGLGKDARTAVFPKLVFTLKRGVNLEKSDPNYEVKQLALKCSAKRMYPDILSYDTLTEITGSFKTPMGCRSFLPSWKDENGEEVNEGRMNLGVVTLNLPRIALESNGDKDVFWRILSSRLGLVRRALDVRIRNVREASPTNAPILYKFGAFGKCLNDNDDVNTLFKDGRATVSLGYIGLYETAACFYGANWEHNPEAKEFTLDVLKKLYDSTNAWKEETGYGYSVYSTPSESLTDRFCRLDRVKFGVVPNITDKDYYTNSFHLDVRKTGWSPFEKLDFEKDYPKYTPGGFIHYCEFPPLSNNLKALETVWDYAYDRVGYFGTNTPIDKCFQCGFEGDFKVEDDGYSCPVCGNNDPDKADVVKRLCGYLGNPLQRPTARGRQIEIYSRVKHHSREI